MSGMTEHPDLHLSAYLDDALAPDERAAVRAHLEGCARCRARFDDLAATSRLIAALPAQVPSRSLLPRVQYGLSWLRPVRLLGSIGTGAFLFLFLASYVVNSGSQLGGGTTGAERLAAQGRFGPAASAAAAENAEKAATPPSPAAAAAPAAASRSTTSAADTAARSGSGPQVANATGAATSVTEVVGRQFGPSPAFFFALALLCAIVAFVAHRRLRRPA